MKVSQFYIVLTIINVLVIAGMYKWLYTPPLKPSGELVAIGLVFHNFLNFWVFYKARLYSIRSDDKRYMELIFINFMTKFFFMIGIPMIYYLLRKPSEEHFIVPYVILYVVFTVFETWFLNRSAIMRSTKSKTL